MWASPETLTESNDFRPPKAVLARHSDHAFAPYLPLHQALQMRAQGSNDWYCLPITVTLLHSRSYGHHADGHTPTRSWA